MKAKGRERILKVAREKACNRFTAEIRKTRGSEVFKVQTEKTSKFCLQQNYPSKLKEVGKYCHIH